jgi:predicted dehydrogenase
MLGHFSYFNDDPSNIRNVPEFGGGALMDIGCYLINTGRFIFEAEPIRVAGAIERDPRLGVDRLTSMLLDFGHGHLVGTCSTQLVPYQRIHIFGTGGRIEIDIPFNAPNDRPCRVQVDTGGPPDTIEVISLDVCDQYTLQGDVFAHAILQGERVSPPLEDAVSNMACIEAVVRSASSGRREVL